MGVRGFPVQAGFPSRVVPLAGVAVLALPVLPCDAQFMKETSSGVDLKKSMELARRFARWDLANSTHADGTLNKAPGIDHTHSYMCTLRGLLLYGQLTHQAKYVDQWQSQFVNWGKEVRICLAA